MVHFNVLPYFLCSTIPRKYHGTFHLPWYFESTTVLSMYHCTSGVSWYFKIYHGTSVVATWYKCTAVQMYYGIFGAQNTVVQYTVVHFTVHFMGIYLRRGSKHLVLWQLTIHPGELTFLIKCNIYT